MKCRAARPPHLPSKPLTPVLLIWAQAAQKAPTEELSKHSKASSATEVVHEPQQAAPGASAQPAAGTASGWTARAGDNLEELFWRAKAGAMGALHRVWAPRVWAPRAS